jgi:integrase
MVRRRHAPEGIYTATDEEWRDSRGAHDPPSTKYFFNYEQGDGWTRIECSCITDKVPQRIGTGFKAACRRAGSRNLRINDFRYTTSTNFRRAGVDTATAMKIVGHKSDRMHRWYHTIELEDLQRAAAQLHAYRTSSVITPGPLVVGAEIVSVREA